MSGCDCFQVLTDYQGSAADLSEDFTVAASNVITTLVFGKEVSTCCRCGVPVHPVSVVKTPFSVFYSMIKVPQSCNSCTVV